MEKNKTNCGIYEIRNILNDNLYIGSSVNLKSRKYAHFNDLKKDKHHCSHLQKAYNKIKKEYGEKNVLGYFEFRILKYIEKIKNKKLLKEELLKWENLELNKYKKEDGNINHTKCYNILPYAGSLLGSKRSEETKQKIRNALKDKKFTAEHRKNISKGHMGIDPFKYLSEGYKREIYDKRNTSLRGKEFSNMHKEKLSISHKDKKHSEEIKDKISKNSPFKKRIANLDTNKEFDSIKEASKFYNIGYMNIVRVCKNERKTAGGHKWSYIV